MRMTVAKKMEIGKTYEWVTVLEWVSNRAVKYRCKCGNVKECWMYDIKRGRVTTCGCRTDEYKKTRSEQCKAKQKLGIMNVGGDYISDELTPFRYIWRLINLDNRSHKNISGGLCLSDLKECWDKQQGKCIYKGNSLTLPTHSNTLVSEKYNQWDVASIDRIDSKKPYTKDNIQFTSRTLNYAKHTMSDSSFHEFLEFMKT